MKVTTDRGVLEAPERLLNLIALAASKTAKYYNETGDELIYRDMFNLSKNIFLALKKGGYYDN